MRTYLTTLHEKPDSHKKRFAFLVSAGCTLLIFSLWSLVKFGSPGLQADTTTNTATLVAAGSKELPDKIDTVTPFEDFKSGLDSSLKAIKSTFSGLSGSANGAN